MDSYRSEKQAAQSIALPEEDAEIEPVPAGGGAHLYEPDMAPLSRIVADFNQLWSSGFTDPDQAANLIRGMPERVVEDAAYRNAKLNSDQQNARIEHDAALNRLIVGMVRCNTELYRLYTENTEFQNWLNREIFHLTYDR